MATSPPSPTRPSETPRGGRSISVSRLCLPQVDTVVPHLGQRRDQMFARCLQGRLRRFLQPLWYGTNLQVDAALNDRSAPVLETGAVATSRRRAKSQKPQVSHSGGQGNTIRTTTLQVRACG